LVEEKFADDASVVALSKAQSACLKIQVKTMASGDELSVTDHHRLVGDRSLL
jgi:hypothetical protein